MNSPTSNACPKCYSSSYNHVEGDLRVQCHTCGFMYYSAVALTAKVEPAGRFDGWDVPLALALLLAGAGLICSMIVLITGP